jgi:hypothetical protein
MGHFEDGDLGELGSQMAALARRFPHDNVWGGCCGTDGSHIGQIARRVAEVRSGRTSVQRKVFFSTCSSRSPVPLLKSIFGKSIQTTFGAQVL